MRVCTGKQLLATMQSAHADTNAEITEPYVYPYKLSSHVVI